MSIRTRAGTRPDEATPTRPLRLANVVVGYVNRRLELLPVGYTPSIPLVSDLAMVGLATAAVLQRGALSPVHWPVLLAALVVISPMLCIMLPLVLPEQTVPLMLAVAGLAGGGALLIWPVPADVAPLILVLAVGETAATAALRYAVVAGGVATVILGVAAATHHLDNPLFYLILVPLGWSVGFMMATQLRLIEQERQAQDQRAEQAAADERRRIAREVHDVVAHSLSVTLLHLTAARRALQEDDDRTEAIDALQDAERLGREAMADIRRTVGLLGDGSPSTTPEPDLTDLPELVEGFSRAGLKVQLRMGAAPDVPASVGLAGYRIVQESLANIAKHAPGTQARVVVQGGDDAVDISVSNTLAAPKNTAAPSGDGRGIMGMRHRAESLGGRCSAGPHNGRWLVHAWIPLNGRARQTCPLGLPL